MSIKKGENNCDFNTWQKINNVHYNIHKTFFCALFGTFKLYKVKRSIVYFSGNHSSAVDFEINCFFFKYIYIGKIFK